MRFARIIVFSLILAAPGIVLSAETEATPPIASSKVVCNIRCLTGNPSGSLEKGSIKILWQPEIIADLGKPSTFASGRDATAAGTTENLFGGIWLTMTPLKIETGRVMAKVSLEVTTLDGADGDAFMSTSGKIVRAVGAFEFGKPLKFVCQERINGEQVWVEIVFENYALAAGKEKTVRIAAEPEKPVPSPKVKDSGVTTAAHTTPTTSVAERPKTPSERKTAKALDKTQPPAPIVRPESRKP